MDYWCANCGSAHSPGSPPECDYCGATTFRPEFLTLARPFHPPLSPNPVPPVPDSRFDWVLLKLVLLFVAAIAALIVGGHIARHMGATPDGISGFLIGTLVTGMAIWLWNGRFDG